MALDPRFLTTPLAHRGFHDASLGVVENSAAAFQRAIEHGYGIETDVQMSSDGHAIVFHDDILDRMTTESGPVRDRTVADLAKIKFCDSPETIPTLAKTLDQVSGKVPLLIEIKDQDGALGPNTGELGRSLARHLQDYQGPVAVMSYNPNAVADVRDQLPKLPLGLVTSTFGDPMWHAVPPERREALAKIADIERVNASFVSHDHTNLASVRVAELKSAGLAIFCWTIRSKAQEIDARRIADTITFEGYVA